MSNEQWKHGGNCDKCRREKYCSKPCSENKKRINKLINDKVAEFFVKGGTE